MSVSVSVKVKKFGAGPGEGGRLAAGVLMLGVVAVVGLAGCSGSDSGDSNGSGGGGVATVKADPAKVAEAQAFWDGLDADLRATTCGAGRGPMAEGASAGTGGEGQWYTRVEFFDALGWWGGQSFDPAAVAEVTDGPCGGPEPAAPPTATPRSRNPDGTWRHGSAEEAAAVKEALDAYYAGRP